MRIGMLNWRDVGHPEAGGAELVVHKQALGLSGRGHEVTLYTSEYPGSRTRDRTYGYQVVRSGGRYGVYPRVALTCKNDSDQLDVLLEHINGIPWLAPYWSDLPVACYLYHRVGRVFLQELPRPLAYLGYSVETLTPHLYRRIPAACLSRSASSEFKSMGFPDAHLQVIPPGVDHEVYRPNGSKFDHPTFLALGPIKEYKRLDCAIRALANLLTEVPTAELLVTGWERPGVTAGLMRLASNLNISKQVVFLGRVSEVEKVRLLQKAWALVYTSEREGWGLGVLEAGACRTLSIASMVGGLCDAVVDSQTGLTYRLGDASQLASCMRSISLDTVLRDKLSRNAEHFASDFTWSKHVTILEEFLKRTNLRSSVHFNRND